MRNLEGWWKRKRSATENAYVANQNTPTHEQMRVRIVRIQRDADLNVSSPSPSTCPLEFTWRFVIADVQSPIIGVDFLSHYELFVDPRNKRLIDTRTQLTARGYTETRIERP